MSQNQTRSRLKARCPECLAAIWLKESVELWDPVICPECHTSLEVTSLRPPSLDYVADWEDDALDLDDGEEWV